jgi:hypothetical protein
MSSDDKVADDALRGARKIGDFLGLTTHQVYHEAEAGRIPVGKSGGLLIASKQRLREHHAAITSGSKTPRRS